MRRSASEILRNLESRIARLEKQSRRIKIEVDEDGELVDPVSVGDECIDLRDIAFEILDSGDFQDVVEEAGDDIDDVDKRDLDLQIHYEGTPSRKEKGVFYFIVEENSYAFGVIVSVDLEGDSSVDGLGEIDDMWDLFNRWT